MKKKIISLSVCASMLALLIVGGTLAYFTDTDTTPNVFTAGNIQIELHESNNNDDPDADYDYDNATGFTLLKDADYRNWLDTQPLVPTAVIEKDVWVDNVGTQPAFVRVHIGVPKAAYDRAVDAGDHIIALDLVTKDTGYADSNWTINDENGNLNVYTENLYGVDYYVLVLTNTEAVAADTSTSICLSNVSMYYDVECSDWNGDYIEYTRGNGMINAYMGKIPVLLFAEAGQQFSFDTVADPAFEALNTQFGTPATSEEYKSPLFGLFDDSTGKLVDKPY